MSDNLVTIAAFTYPVQAEMARLRLEAAGIACLIASEAASQGGQPRNVLGGFKVQVKEDDAARALGILRGDAEDEDQE